MMVFVFSIIFRMVFLWTLSVTLVSFGRMILGRGERRSRMKFLGRMLFVNSDNLGRGEGVLKGLMVFREGKRIFYMLDRVGC